MGGYGSGRHSYRGVLEHSRRLDVNRWHREGLFRGVTAGLWVWRDKDGHEVASIGYRASPHEVTLTYTLDPRGEEARGMEYTVPIAWTPCTFGGERPWFECPSLHCQRRAGKLYLRRGYFLCRRCTGLRYQSQREDRAGRMMLKAQSIRAKVGGGPNLTEPFPPKPKGMHWRTYERLRADEEWANYGGLMLAVQKLGLRV